MKTWGNLAGMINWRAQIQIWKCHFTTWWCCIEWRGWPESRVISSCFVFGFRCSIPLVILGTLSVPPSYQPPPSIRTRKQHPAFVPDRYNDDCSQHVRFVLQAPCRQWEMICRREQCLPLPWTGVPNLICTFIHTTSWCIIYLCHVPDLMLRLSDCIKCRGTILCWITDGFFNP